MHPSDRVVITATENPSTGFTWQLSPTSNTAVYTIESDRHLPRSSKPGMVGVPGTRQISLLITGAGHETLQMIYARPWEMTSESFSELAGTPGTYLINLTSY